MDCFIAKRTQNLHLVSAVLDNLGVTVKIGFGATSSSFPSNWQAHAEAVALYADGISPTPQTEVNKR